MSKISIPKPDVSFFKDRKKEAAFWEKNIETVWSQSKPKKVKFTRSLSETINIRLDTKTIDIVRYEADRKGIGPTQLIRMWIKEKLENRPIQTTLS